MPWHPLDHALFVILMVVLPLEGLYTFRRLVAAVRAGEPDAKVRTYRMTIVLQLTLAATLVIGWYIGGRPWAALGLGRSSPWGAIAGAACVAVGLAFVAAQQRAIRRLSAAQLERLSARMSDLSPLLPTTAPELRWFSTVSVTAGICEEMLYRGFVLWYLTPLTGIAGAVVAGSVLFGLAHAYQGRSGAIKTAIVGAVMAGFYLASGTLWASMIVHAAIDLSGGTLGRRLA
jgi:membrane protease YdiL (CAAX protease family)